MTRRFQYDGAEVAAVYNTLGGIKERYVRGAGADEIVVCYGECYAGATGSSKAWLIADERGTIIAGTDSSGATLFKNVYDEYGKPGAANQGRFQYTGQMWLAEAGLYHYKARIYDPGLGLLGQIDPPDRFLIPRSPADRSYRLWRRHEHVRLCRKRSDKQC